MQPAVTAEEMRALDAATIHEIGLPGAVLMENAGRAVARVVLAALPPRGGRVAVVCGTGNNGGDGFVIARCLREAGRAATVFLAGAGEAVAGDARLHLGVYEQCGGQVASIADGPALFEHAASIEQADVVVDALFGTGLARPIGGHLAEVVAAINRARGVRVAVDVPSGLSADTGEVLGVAVAADRTVTLGFAKLGLVSAPGFARCGELTVVDIGIPSALAGAQGVRAAVLEAADAARWLPVESRLDHKATRGHLLVVAGSPGKRGAGRLAALAGLRAGAGLVTLAAAVSGGELVAPDAVMTAELDADAAGAADVLADLARGKRALAIGPGMALGEGGRGLVRAALSRLALPLVLDADALNHLGDDLAAVAAAAATVVLTPHPGEAARLLDTTTAAVERDRVAAVRALAQGSRAVVVLKGARTLVCDGSAGDGFVTVNPTGNAGLATAGSGDVLTGVIGALLAQGVPAPEAARLGVYAHGRAADLWRTRRGPRGLTAGDLLDLIAEALVVVPD